jgi:nucleoid DNA-binding protein
MNKDAISINKRLLWQFVNRKIKRVIHHAHVFSIICILFEEMFKDLQQGKEIKIANFGKFFMKEMKPRKYHNVRYMQVMQSNGYKILRFSLSSQVRKKILDYLDIDKTFKDD